MDARYAVLIAVGEEGSGGLIGRTLLQKKLYFASLLVDEDLGFRPYYYGPYSQEIANATDSLVSNRFLKERVDIFPDSNIFGERRRYSYQLTPDGSQILGRLKKEPGVAAWCDALKKINEHSLSHDFDLLSIAAKVKTILREAGEATIGDIEQKAREYGWTLTRDEIDRVAGFLESLKLVSRTQPRGSSA